LKIENGKWLMKMENGKWSKESGELKLECGKWTPLNGNQYMQIEFYGTLMIIPPSSKL
jgi:hypothetical protein